jgi:hypothetical protein
MGLSPVIFKQKAFSQKLRSSLTVYPSTEGYAKGDTQTEAGVWHDCEPFNPGQSVSRAGNLLLACPPGRYQLVTRYLLLQRMPKSYAM